jgi:hypothetical protein
MCSWSSISFSHLMVCVYQFLNFATVSKFWAVGAYPPLGSSSGSPHPFLNLPNYLKAHMWDTASFSQTVSILCVSVAVFPSFKQNLMFICCCIMMKKKYLTHLAPTDDLTELEHRFHWPMVFMTWTTEICNNLVMHTKPYLHKSISPRTLFWHHIPSWQYWVNSTN